MSVEIYITILEDASAKGNASVKSVLPNYSNQLSKSMVELKVNMCDKGGTSERVHTKITYSFKTQT